MKRLLPLCALLLCAACVDHLPDQDRRILSGPPAFKTSTDLLLKEYQADKRAADKKYFGKSVEVTGKVTSVVQDSATPPLIIFLPEPKAPAGVHASLLDDRAPATLAAAVVGQKLTLRCFCEGLATNVILKSCVKP